MKHFMHLNAEDIQRFFYSRPSEFNYKTPKDLLRYSLGATLYMPATKYLGPYLLEKRYSHLTSYVMCFEKYINESDISIAEKTVINTLRTLKMAEDENRININELPLFFIRVRNIEQFKSFYLKLTAEKILLKYLSGFILPQFDTDNALEYMKIINEIRDEFPHIYALPLLESKRIFDKRTRETELLGLYDIIRDNKDSVLNIRIGGNSFSSFNSIKKSIYMSVYDIGVMADCIYDILNVFSDMTYSDLSISGSIWEYYNLSFSPNKNIGTFNENRILSRIPFTNDEAIDGLIREVLLDKENGMIGKTIKHPAQTAIVNALYCITLDQYKEANSILLNNSLEAGTKNLSLNKLNSENSNYNWAKKIMNLSRIYGVLNDKYSYIDLF